MKRRFIIQKFTAAILLLVFCIGNTPKSAFHFVFADHTDDTACTTEGVVIRITGKTCDILDLVCSLPFQADHAVITVAENDFHLPADYETVNILYKDFQRVPPLRGPPAERSI